MKIPASLPLYSCLAFGVACMSCAAILIRLAEATPFAISAYRVSIAAVILIPITSIKQGNDFLKWSTSVWLWSSLAGLLLAVHFATWITSLAYTSVASSVMLVTTAPVFVGMLSHWGLRERLSARMFTGILVAVSGGVVIGYGDYTTGVDPLFGDLLAIAGAISAGGYFVIGRKLRSQVDLLPYITVVYSTAAVWLVGLALATGQPMSGYTPSTYLILIGLAVGPQLLGHSSLNWALKYLSAVLVSVVILTEPIGSTILAYLILNEEVTRYTLIGGMLVLTGIYVVIGQERGER
ncbi:MAG TPA: EamA/RhaT family transporter [Candidatus Latescibacteria bacterium]|jgi:drug/metabolite transporter (DMT)-like permease|nr:EamA/RhaT family transporter [Candidatus Latescibacterota bacterium]